MPSLNEPNDHSSKKEAKSAIAVPAVKPAMVTKRRGNQFTDTLRSIIDLSASFEKNDPQKAVERGIKSMMNNLAGNDLKAGFAAMLVNAAEGETPLAGLEKLKTVLGENFLNCVANILGDGNRIKGIEEILNVIGGENSYKGLWLIMNKNGRHDYKNLGIFVNMIGEGKRSKGLEILFEALEHDRYKGFIAVCEIIKGGSGQNSTLKAFAKLCSGVGLGNTAMGFRDIISALGTEDGLSKVIEYLNPENHREAITNFMAMLSSDYSVGLSSLIASAGGGFPDKNGLVKAVGVKGLSSVCNVLSKNRDTMEGFAELLAMQGNGVIGLNSVIMSLAKTDKQKGLEIICLALGGEDKTAGFSILLRIIGEGDKEKGLTPILVMLGGGNA